MTTAQDFALSATRKYLQSVVFVDDKIYETVLAQPVEVIVKPAGKMDVFNSAQAKPQAEKAIPAPTQEEADTEAAVSEETDTDSPFRPKHLVESFARERMVCALYEPAKGFKTDPESELFKLCERADVVILDWEFHKEPGKKVMDLIGGLVTAAQTTVPHHVRLLAIYTSTQNLKHVAQQVCDHLSKLTLEVQVDGEYDLNAGSSRIIVLGKPTTGRPAEQAEQAEVKEADLAQRIIDEFAKMHAGILPSMALHGLASIRTNTKKILDKFHADMDGVFLAQRGLISPADDAFEQIPELLAEEALAVMIDSRPPPAAADAMANDYIDTLKLKTAWPDRDNKPTEVGLYATRMLKEGPQAIKSQVKLDLKKIRKLIQELGANSSKASERLAALYVCRTQYGEERFLEFGTVVRYTVKKTDNDGNEQSSHRYAICLMPLCDSVRLINGETYSFPLWNLKEQAPKGPSKGLVIELPSKEGFLELYSYGKPRDQLFMDDFVAGNQNMVMAAKDHERFKLKGNKYEYEWVAQLKPSHAQRIAHELGTSLARVGVTEAEWVRLKADGAED